MIFLTIDPVSMMDVHNPDDHPYIIEGEGEAAMKIYFENQENKAAYLDLHFGPIYIEPDLSTATELSGA